MTQTAPTLSRQRLTLKRRPIKSTRVTTHLVAEGRCGDRKVVGWLLDLSSEGLFFRHSEPFALGDRVSLEFYLPDPGTVIRCLALVTTRVEGGKLWPAGNRLTFWVMRPAHVAALDHFIARQLALRRAPAYASQLEESLIHGTLPLSALTALPMEELKALSIETLPDVGAFLEELGEADAFEAFNDVGHVRPEDLILVH